MSVSEFYFRRMYMQTTETATKKKNIIIIGTGGTIAGTGKKGKTGAYNSAQIEINKLICEIPCLESVANIKSNELFSIDSCDMSFKKIQKLTDYINETSKNDDVDGFVITHGTDTLEETAYFLNLAVKTDKPVVITGSMRPSTALSADGPFNLYQSVALAQNEEAIGKGVLIAFSDAIYGARDICKINTFRTTAFDHKDLGCLGYMQDDKVFFYNFSTKKHTLNSEFDIKNIKNLPKVEILMFYADAGIDILEHVSKNSDGIVLAGVGIGGSSLKWNQKIEEILNSGIPVVRSSRVANGLVTYDQCEISKKGIYACNLSPQKARILLTLALTKTKNITEIQKMFEIY